MRLLITLSIACFAAPAWADELKPAKETKPAAVEFELLATKHMAVQIKINGKGPYRVIFDTGAPITLLNNRIAKEANLTVPKDNKLPVPLWAPFGMRGQMVAKTFEVGELKAEDVTVIVMDHPALKAVSQVLGPVDGIVGFPFFARYRMSIDYQAKEMTFVPVNYQPSDIMEDLMTMMLNMQKAVPKKVYSPATVWGLVVDKEEGDMEPGVTIKEVRPGGAAAAAGLKPGDRLLILDGTWTDSVADAHRAAAGVQPGQTIKATIKRDTRDDKTQVISITPKAGL